MIAVLLASGCDTAESDVEHDARAGDIGHAGGAGDLQHHDGQTGAGGIEPDAGEVPTTPGQDLEWAALPAGSFSMGSASGDPHERPVHVVNIAAFELMKTEVTVAQYAKCVTAGVCTEPDAFHRCNWGVPGRELHPVNCVSGYQARTFAAFVGGGARLPSEAEWEYAARSGGGPRQYPWGDEEADCARAVMVDATGHGCGAGSTWPVCSKTSGSSEQGVCDLAGNVWEWVEDSYHDSYEGAPTDGSTWIGRNPAGSVRRGGSWNVTARGLRASARLGGESAEPGSWSTGFRLATSDR